jgi:hypothetical protein
MKSGSNVRHVVGDEDDGLASLHPDLLDKQIHLVAGEGVQRAERLVHEDDVRVVGETAHDTGALLHAAGKLARHLLFEPGQPHFVEEIADAALVRPGVDLLDFEGELDVLPQVAPWQQIGVLEDHADLGTRPHHRRAVDDDLACGHVVQPGHAPQQRALAAPGRTQNADELPFGDLQREIFQRVDGPGAGLVVLADVPDRHGDRPRPGLGMPCAVYADRPPLRLRLNHAALLPVAS